MKDIKKEQVLDELEDIEHIENIKEIELENVQSIAKELEQVKCPNCGYVNVKLTKKCTKCRYDLDFVNKSCPKCGKICANAVKKCECGFDFTRKKGSLIGNLIVAIIIMIILFVIYRVKGDFIETYDVAIKTLAIYAIFVLLVKTFGGKGKYQNYGAEAEMLKRHKRITNPKLFSNLLIIIFGIGVTIFLVYYYFFR